jgi:hypothetical protein
VHLPKIVALMLLSKAFEQSNSSSAFVEISGIEALSAVSLYPFNFLLSFEFCACVCVFSFFFFFFSIVILVVSVYF